MSRLSIGCCLVLVFAISSYAQVASLKCLSKPYEWSGPPELNPDIPELVALENADILVEDLRVSFLRSKPEFLTVVFERHLVLRFGTREAVEEHARFIIPESFDPVTDYRDVAWERRDSLPRPLYFETRLEQFNARVIGPIT
jgi:hypothetical protein